MNEPLEPTRRVSPRDQVAALLGDLVHSDGTASDPLDRARVSGLRTVLCLLDAEEQPLTSGQRLAHLRKARAHARTTTFLTAYLLNDATLPGSPDP
ncbi:hypothetical protein [Streptomyces afghaniensis]|uniref:hypothetical protein n=1 Tax=Streptomyces afghaniensis TaxID=66865 RepID=UPI00278B995B|nr:hypothetical protein [Streptomyces afghaniensis]MDQ1020044.1 hypothetical protein [Streptomyces afghaniensis]